MNVLILGSGGREHAFAWKIAQSTKCDNLFVAPGNAGTHDLATNINLDIMNFDQVSSFIKDENIHMVLIGPEAPLVEGIRDYLESDSELDHLLIVGPSKLGASLEGSKDFSKEFLFKHNIPTAAYATFTSDNYDEGVKYLEKHTLPIVLKADGLAAGKGVVIAETIDQAKLTFKEMLLDAKFGDASLKVVVEEYLKGIELSVFVLTDGDSYVILPEAKDYKRIGEGDKGLNTGGMGAISPVPFAHDGFLDKVEELVVKPTINGLKEDGIDYQGFIFIGLMNVGGEPYVIEYNVRMGDPETEAVLPRIKSDFLDVLEASCNRNLSKINLQIDEDYVTTVIMVAEGYPESYRKGDVVSNLDQKINQNSVLFHAGTKVEGDTVITNGGRVMACSSKGKSIEEALENSYELANTINWEGKYFRKDIGFDLI